MSELVLFYLGTSAIHVVPVLVITFSFYYGIPFSGLLEKYFRQVPATRGPKRSGITQIKQYVQMLDSDSMSYLSKYYLLLSGVQIATVALITLAIQFEVPLPFLQNVIGILSPEKLTDLLTFVTVTNTIQFIPIVLLLLALVLRARIPFMPPFPKRGAPPNSEILGWKRNSKHFASICLKRLETPEKTFIYATCRKAGSRKILKSVLIQGKEPEARTEFYLYNVHNQFLKKQILAPISVQKLEEIMNVDNYYFP